VWWHTSDYFLAGFYDVGVFGRLRVLFFVVVALSCGIMAAFREAV
jgi:hypothetical protein